jgi:hypothetical protein
MMLPAVEPSGSAANKAAIENYNEVHGTVIGIRHMLKKKQLLVETGDEGCTVVNALAGQSGAHRSGPSRALDTQGDTSSAAGGG